MHLLHNNKKGLSSSGLKEECMGIKIYVHVSFVDDKILYTWKLKIIIRVPSVLLFIKILEIHVHVIYLLG